MYQGVTLSGFFPTAFNFTFNLAAAVTAANVGHGVALDTTANNTVKVPADGDNYMGVLRSYEDRTLEGMKAGAVATKCGTTLKYTGTLAVGDYVCASATANTCKKLAAGTNNARVTSIDATNNLCEVLFG